MTVEAIAITHITQARKLKLLFKPLCDVAPSLPPNWLNNLPCSRHPLCRMSSKGSNSMKLPQKWLWAREYFNSMPCSVQPNPLKMISLYASSIHRMNIFVVLWMVLFICITSMLSVLPFVELLRNLQERVRPLLDSVLAGRNSTVFAYGQTVY
jgi:hypothetical protein